MKLVAVSQRVDAISNRDECRDGLDQRLSQWLISAGYMPVPVPNQLAEISLGDTEVASHLLIWLDAIKPAGILLSGGNDIGECPERDKTEHILLQWAEKNHKPVLGICRGMQLLGVSAGGSLKPVTGHVCTSHMLTSDIFSGVVNSYHNFVLAECPSTYKVLARAEDGEIEAIRHEYLPWEGWMWHPERDADFQWGHILRVRNLFGE